MKGEIVVPASGAGAPYWVQRLARLEEIVVACVELATPDMMDQTLPSCGWRVVVSLSL